MNRKFRYQSDDFDRESQRFVIPLYVKNDLGNYLYSSTATLTKYNSHFYIIFAAHALSNDITVDNFYIFRANGNFRKLSDVSIGSRVFKSDDIVIVDCFNQMLDGNNYFNLNETHMLGFDKKHFAWTGFPFSKSKTKEVHNSKSSESLKSRYVHNDETGTYFKSSSYFSIISKIKSNNKINISGSYERKSTSLKYKGEVSMAPHPEGMSGGAMYFFSKGQKLKKSLDDTFRFAGIGIEYKKNGDIIGVSKDKIIELLEQFNTENPLQLNIQSDGI